jgi:hypothetical protein
MKMQSGSEKPGAIVNSGTGSCANPGNLSLPNDAREMIVSVTPAGQGEHTSGWSETTAKVLTGPLVWAVLIAFLAVRLRSPINRLIDALRQRVEDGDDLDLLGVRVSKQEFRVDAASGVKVEEKILAKGVDKDI